MDWFEIGDVGDVKEGWYWAEFCHDSSNSSTCCCYFVEVSYISGVLVGACILGHVPLNSFMRWFTNDPKGGPMILPNM